LFGGILVGLAWCAAAQDRSLVPRRVDHDRIFKAAEEGSLDVVRNALDAGYDINKQHPQSGSTLLISALSRNRVPVAEFLLARGADVTLATRVGNTALHEAASLGNVEIARELLDRGAQVNQPNNEGRTPFHFAVRHGRVEVVRLLIAHGANLNRVSGFGDAPIDLALQSNRPELAELLIDSGATLAEDVDAASKRIATAAAKDWITVVMAILVDAEGRPELLQRLIDVAYDAALAPNHVELLTALASYGPGPSDQTRAGLPRLVQACFSGSFDLIEALLKRGADVDQVTQPARWTPLHVAAHMGRRDVVKRLLESGADPNVQDGAGHTPLHLASNRGASAVVLVLLQAGADPNVQNFMGRTPLHLAAMSGKQKVVEALLDAGAERDLEDRNGQTPVAMARDSDRELLVPLLTMPDPPAPAGLELLAEITADGMTPGDISAQRRLLFESYLGGIPLAHLAVTCGSVRALTELLAKTPDAAVERDRYGYTLLHAAVRGGETAAVSEVIGLKADVNDAANLSRWTPLHFAAAAGQDPLVRLLLDHGADLSATDALGRTPADVARLNGHTTVTSEIRWRGESP
jgi:ankyrin repeat protein